MRSVLVSLLLLFSLVPLASPAAAESFTVTASGFQWNPPTLTIAPGDSVAFVDEDGSHTWVRDDGSDSCTMPCTRAFTVEETVDYHCGVHPSMTGSIVVGSPPVVSIDSPAAGAVLSGVVTVEGTATHATSAIIDVTVRLGSGEHVTATLAGDGASWSADVPTEGLANGGHTLRVSATAANGLTGEAIIEVTVDNQVFVDLDLVSASASATGIFHNTISFTVENDGNVPSGAFTVAAEYFHDGAWRPIGAVGVASLAPGAFRTGSISWDPAALHVGGFDVRVTADPGEELPDPDRANNARTARAGWFTNAVPGMVFE